MDGEEGRKRGGSNIDSRLVEVLAIRWGLQLAMDTHWFLAHQTFHNVVQTN